MNAKNIKVILAKTGIDTHDRGLKVLTRGLRDAGMEVIFLGFRQKPDGIAAAASQEDADVVGLSFSTGSSLPATAELVQKLKEADVRRPLLLVGGNIASSEIAKLKEMGVDAVFTSAHSIETICNFIVQNVRIHA